MEPTEYSLYLTLRHAGKTIPYPAEERTDSANHGFVSLKENPTRINSISEANEHPCLARALERINAQATAFYTAGCDYSLNIEDDGTQWAKGYLDIIFSNPTQAQDSHAYFTLFGQFDSYLRDKQFNDPVDFHWDLEQTEFLELGISGWTLCLWITTDVCDTKKASQASWDAASDLFCSFLEQIH